MMHMESETAVGPRYEISIGHCVLRKRKSGTGDVNIPEANRISISNSQSHKLPL